MLATPMRKMLVCVAIFFLVILSVYAGKRLIMGWYMSHYQPPPVVVSDTEATTKSWRDYVTSVGSLTAINGVDLSSEVAGIVKDIRFQSGQTVKKGDVIILLDTSIEEANLKNNKANLQLAKMNHDREQQLFSRNVSSQASLDTRNAQLLEAEANVEAVEAQIKQKTITAPFDGDIGIRLVDLGQYVSPGKAMVTLQALDPLYVNFNLPEKYLPTLALNQEVEITVNFAQEKSITGKITAINSKVDQATRNILVQATIPNANHQLYPGMFASVKVWYTQTKPLIVVPQTAVSYSLSGDYVFIIKSDNRAYRQYVKVGERRGDEVSIVDGLTAGERIITTGQLKLQNGASVKVDNKAEM